MKALPAGISCWITVLLLNVYISNADNLFYVTRGSSFLLFLFQSTPHLTVIQSVPNLLGIKHLKMIT